MAPRKLSDSDKSELIDLYKQPGQTTTTLAEHFGVSNSTVSRILKSTIPAEEYRELISQKRMAGSDKSAPAKKSSAAKKSAAKASKKKTEAKETEKEDATKKPARKTKSRATKQTVEAEPPVDEQKSEQAEASTSANSKESGGRRRRRRSNAKQTEDEQLPLLAADAEATEEDSKKVISAKPSAPILASDEAEEDEDDDDDLQGLDETLGDDFGDDDLDEEDDDDDDDDVELPKPKLQSQNAMEIMSLGEAVLPKPCYLVVDMRSELITRPLSEFADLGQVPSSEEKAKTLPVFDNHRVARRFSRNKQRVIKVPDGNLITRTSPYLQAKGITRLLVNGQVFDLAE